MAYYFRNKISIIDVRSEAKVEQIMAIVTARCVSCIALI